MTRLRPAWPFVPDPDVGSLRDRQLSPRCHAPMHAYEGVWGALLDGVVCGRPEGHSGQHRSVQSLNAERSRKRWQRQSERRRELRQLARLPLADQLAIAVDDAAEEARWDALGR